MYDILNERWYKFLDINKNQYKEVFENIKNEILKSQYRAMQVVNKELIFMYWHIGNIILENRNGEINLLIIYQLI